MVCGGRGGGEGTYVEQHAEVGGCGERGHDDEVCGRGSGQGGDGGGDGEFHGCVCVLLFLLIKKDRRREVVRLKAYLVVKQKT